MYDKSVWVIIILNNGNKKRKVFYKRKGLHITSNQNFITSLGLVKANRANREASTRGLNALESLKNKRVIK